MTLNEYSYRMLAYRLKKIDEDEAEHKKAWLNVIVNNEKEIGNGKNKKKERVFKNFTDFYNKEEMVKAILGTSETEKETDNKKVIKTKTGFNARKAAEMAAKVNGVRGD